MVAAAYGYSECRTSRPGRIDFSGWFVGYVLYAMTAILVLSNPRVSAAGDVSREILTAVVRHFASQQDYQRGDLIHRSDLAAVLKHLQETGVSTDRFATPEQIAALEARIPAESSEIQKLNARQAGKQFLRRVASIPGGYAGVEDLASRPDGVRDLRKLTKAPGGEKMIDYIATTKGGRQMMAMTPQGATTRRRTDKRPPAPPIYTADDLIQALMELSRIPPSAKPAK